MKQLQPKYYRTLCLALLSAVLLMALSACSHDDAQDYDGMPDVAEGTGSQFRMYLSVVSSSNMSTRVEHKDDEEELGIASENYIDFTGNDFRIVLFDNAGNYLHEMDAMDKWTVFPSPYGDYVFFQMECEIEFPETVSKATIENIKNNGLQVMVIANWQSFKGQTAYDNLFVNGGTHQSLAAIWKNGTSNNFVYNPTGNMTWLPDHTASAKKLIPMFGYAKAVKFEVRNDGVHYTSTTIQMQRALAKIEVIDNLENQPSLSVSDVTMTDFNTVGRLIPDIIANPNWNKTGEQVGTSSLPNDNVQQRGANLQFFHDATNKKWIAYVPEMALGALYDQRGEPTSNRPHLNVEIQSTLDYYSGDTYTAHFAKYDQFSNPTIPDESWNHILRNHIYRFSVNKVGLTVQLHLHVIPWDADEDEEWDFTDHVTVQHMLEWNPNTYESLNDEDGEIVLSLEKGKLLEGNFRISTPINGRWYARLTPLDDSKTNAITFADKDGNVLQPSSGDPAACLENSDLIDINSEVPTTLYIRPTNYGNEAESKFRLEFFVENLGVWMEVPMTNNGKYKYYTIVRKTNIIE